MNGCDNKEAWKYILLSIGGDGVTLSSMNLQRQRFSKLQEVNRRVTCLGVWCYILLIHRN